MTRSFLGFAGVFLVSHTAFAAEVVAPSRLDAVTVFLSGAEVTRTAKVKLEKGEHTVLFNDIPASAVQGSIRVEGKATGKLEIGSVDTRRTFLARAESQAADAERKKLEDELDGLRDQKALLEAQVQGAETQKALVANLAQLPSRPAPQQGQAAPEDWQKVLSLIGQGAADAARSQVDAQAKLRDLEHRIEVAENRLTTMAPPKTEQTEVKVYVEAASPLEADLVVKYQVANAGWTPLYDARLQTGSKTAPPKLELARRAAISQRSGENWEVVSLQLSTARPSASAAMPELAPQTVDFVAEPKPAPMSMPAPAQAPARMEKRKAATGRSDGADNDEVARELAAAPPPPAPEPVDAAERPSEITSAPFEATYSVAGKVSVPGNGEAKRVMLMTEQIEPELAIKTVPKSDSKAYLYARMLLAKGSPLLPGQVYLFRDGTFVGTGRIPLLPTGEQHDLGFGIDDQIKVRYSVLEEKRAETGLISSSHNDIRNFRVTLKNLHERAMTVTVIDQVPVSQNQEIKVEYTGKVSPTKSNVDDKRGVMNFDFKLDPDEEKVLDIGYRVIWPAARSVIYGSGK